MNDVDKAYYEAIVSEIDSHKVKWTVSYYNEADIQRCSAMLYSLGISSSQIRFELLEDFYSNQLKLFL